MGKGIDNRTTRKLLLGSASALAIAFTQAATAQSCGSGSNTTIAAACTAPFDWTGGNLSITSLGTISGSGYGVGVASGSVGEFSNLGAVSAASMSYGLSVSAGATIGKLTNSGTIAAMGAAVYAMGSIGTLANSGLLDTPNSGISIAATGVIDTILNQAGGTINASWALYNYGHVGTFTNAGTLTPSRIGVNNKTGGIIDVIENTGFINSPDRGIQSNGTIGSISNTGTIVGTNNSGIGISNSPTGVIGTITNSGLIRGISPGLIQGAGILAAGTITLISNSGTIEGNQAGVAVYLSPSKVSTLYNAATGTIRTTGLHGGVDNYGTIESLINDGLITGSTYALANTGSMMLVNGGRIEGDINNTGTLTISGGSGGTVGTLTGLNGSIGSFTGSSLIFDTGALLINDVVDQGVTVVGTGGTLINSGTLQGVYGVLNTGTIALLNNTVGGLINSTSGTAVYSYTDIGTLTNAGTISGGNFGVNLRAHTSIVTNSGLISGIYGMTNSGVVTSLSNSGTIQGGTNSGLANQGAIGTLTNTGRIEGRNGLANNGNITILRNDGTISAASMGLANWGTIGTLTNYGVINGNYALTHNTGTITILTNYGTIQGTSVALMTGAGIGALTNNGLITSANYAISNGGSRLLVNNGVIAGGIDTGDALTISGGSNGTVGTLTGYNGGLGAVTGTLYFGTGALLLHDAFSAPLAVVGQGGTLTNTGTIGAQLTVSSGATLALLSNAAEISYSGNVALSVAGRIDRIDNSAEISGRSAIKPNAGSSIGTISNTGTIHGTNYAFYNQGSIDRIENDGEISSGTYAIYNRATGTISSFINNASGTLTGTTIGIYSLGTIGTIENHGLISSNRAIAISGPSVTEISNSGTIRGSGSWAIGLTISSQSTTIESLTNLAGGVIEGIASDTSVAGSGEGINLHGTIRTLSNFGSIHGNEIGIDAVGGSRIDTFNNSGTITGDKTGFNNGLIGTLTNTGVISGSVGLHAHATIATLVNSGTISGSSNALIAENFIDVFENSGLIGGNIVTAEELNITGGSGTVFGMLSGGTITGNVKLGGGNTRFADDVVGRLDIEGGIVEIASHVSITGSLTQGGGVLDLLSGGELIVAGDAHLSGGLIVVEGLSATGNYTAGDQMTLIAADDGSDYSGASIQLSIPGVSATTTIANGDLIAIFGNDYVGGTLAGSTIAGSIGGGDYGYFVGGTGNIGSLTNNGTLNGDEFAFYNGGTIGTLENNGQIVDGTGLANAGSIGALTNNAVISGGNGLANYGTIDTLTNAASGVITGTTHAGIYNTGSIGQLTNSGTITGSVHAIDNAGSLGLITNSGTIAGNIRSTSPLAIAGGTGAAYGVLSGGTITADVNFTAGNLRLSDAVVGQVSNSGAQLQLGSALTITGTYGQTAGTLELGSNILTVSGKASISGGTVTASLASAANYLAGQSITLIDAATGSSYAGASVSLTPITGLAAAAATASTEDLAITFGNDYIGGSLASLNNTGTLSGAAYGVYVASTGALGALSNAGTIRGTQYALYSAGSLGTITNTGLISGNIRSTGHLVLAGTGGTLSGGTITATGVSIAGSLRLADAINVGSGTVSAGTASVELPSKISITGNYLQTGGVLISDVTDTTTYGALAVSGSATITNTTITLNGSTFRAGQTYTIVDASAASSYSGDTIQLVGPGHFRLKLLTEGDDLLALIRPMFGEIGTAKGGAAAVVGGVLDRIADANGLPTMIDWLSALSDDDLGKALAQAAPAEVGGGVASLQRMSLIEDLIGTAVTSHRSAATGWSVWQEALGGAAKRSAASGTAGYDTTAIGLVLGVDNRIRENLLVGAAVSWSAGWNAGRGDVAGHANGVNGFALTGYGSWTEGALTVNGRVAAGLDHYKQHRTLTALSEKAEADYSGQHYVIAADGSYDFTLAPGVTLSPQASLRWLRLAADGYSETGFGALTVGSVTADQVQSNLGAKLAWSIDTRFGLVMPEIRAAWLHDFLNDAGETNAVLGGLSFTTTSARISANGIRVGTGLTFYHSDATSLRLEYDGDFRDDYMAHGGMLQLSLKL